MSEPGLDTFFEQLGAMLDGRRSAAEVEAVLGPSASGTARLALYRTLVERQQRGVIDEFYAAVKVACETIASGSFARHRDAYLKAHPPAPWAPAAAAASFPAFLEGRAVKGELVELADLAWARHLVLQAPARDDVSGLCVRHYAHAALAFTADVERGRQKGRPKASAETWLMGRSRHTGRFVAVVPSVAALVLLQRLEEPGTEEPGLDVSGRQLRGEAEQLCELGLLSKACLATHGPRLW